MNASASPRFALYSPRVVLAALLFVLYLITGSGGFHIIDEVSLYSVTENLARRGAWDTDQIAWSQWVNSPAEVLGAWGSDGHVYSKKGVAPALAYLPLRALAGFIPGIGLLQATFLSNALITIVTALLLWAIVRRLGYGERLGAAAALIFGVATLAWPYATHLFGEPLSALCLTAALWGAIAFRQQGGRGSLFVAGLALAGAILTSAVYTLLLPVFGAYWLWAERRLGRRLPGWRDLVALGAPLALGAAFLLWYNNLRFGSPLTTGYHFDSGEGFNGPLLAGLYGLLISPYRGIIYHQPLTLVALVGFVPFFRRHRAEAILTGVIGLILLLVFAKWWIWWGGFAWGPRFLVPLAPLLVLWLTPLLAGRWRWLTWAIIALSAIVQLLAVSANYVLWEIELRGLYPTDWNNPLLYGAPATSNPLHSPVFGQLYLLARGPLADVIDLGWWQANGIHVWVPLVGLGLMALAGWLLWRLSQRRRAGWATLTLGLAVLVFSYFALRVYAVNEHYGPPTGYPAILAEISASERADDTIVSVAPYHYHIPMNRYNGGLPILGFAQEQPLRPETERLLTEAAAKGGTIYLVTAGLPPADPSNGVEQWLDANAYLADDRWFNDFRLVRFGAAEPALPLAAGQRWGTPAVLTLADAFISTRTPAPSSVLTLALTWQTLATARPDLHLFVQIIPAVGGPPVAQLDRAFPTATWSPDQPQTTRLGLWLPPDLPAGDYQLIAGWYDPASGQRLTTDGADAATLTDIIIP